MKGRLLLVTGICAAAFGQTPPFHLPAAPVDRFMPSGLRVKALDEFRRMSYQRKLGRASATVPAVTSSSTWTMIGPQQIIFPQNNWQYISGWVTALVVDPRNPAVVFAGSAGGGVWKTTNAGQSWTPLTDNQPSLAVGALALDPSNPDVVYVGTGYRENHNPESYSGVGILKSMDGGATWTHLPGPFMGPESTAQGGTNILALAVSPTNSQNLLVAVLSSGSVPSGIWRSADGGASWASVLPVAVGGSVVFDPQNGNTAYAGMSFGQPSANGIYKSVDAGKTWTHLNGTSNGLPTSNVGHTIVAVSPSNPSTLYAGIADSSTNNYTLLGLFKSVDGGSNWAQLVNSPDYCGPNRCGNRHFISVNPANPNIVFLGSQATSPFTPLYRTLDGGQTWTEISVGANNQTIFADGTAAAFSSDGAKVYYGSDGGVYSTTDIQTTAVHWANLNSNLAIASIPPGMSLHPTAANVVFAGASEGGTLKYTGGLDWRGAGCGDGSQTALDPSNPNTIYATCLGSLVPIKANAAGLNYTQWSDIASGIDSSDIVVTFPPIVVDPSHPQTVYFGSNRIYQSNSGGASWTPVSPYLATGNNAVSVLAVAPSDSNTVYAGTDPGNIYVTTNAGSGTGSTWLNRSTGLPSRWITQIAVDPANSLVAYATAGYFSGFSDKLGHVFKTIDGGQHWTDISGNLPNIPADDIVIDPDIPGTLYVATDVGVLATSNGGATWTPVGNGLPAVPVTSLRLQRPTRTLFAGTWGGSVWNLWSPVPGQVRITISANVPGAVFSLEDGSNFQAPATLSWTPGARHTVTWLVSSPDQPGVRYAFQNWADSNSTSNARTIIVPSTNSSYSANITVQYQVIFTSNPPGAGTLTVTPSSPDGYYNAGATLQVTASPTYGYDFSSFAGAISGGSPQSVTLSSPLDILGDFVCHYRLPFPSAVGPGPTSAFIEVSVGSTCSWAIGNGSEWLSAGPPNTGSGTVLVPLTIQPNPGASRAVPIPLANSTNIQTTFYTGAIAQDASASARPSMLSLTPSSGSGSSQVFSYQVFGPDGYQTIALSTLVFDTEPPGNQCQISATQGQAQNSIYLVDDDGTTLLGPLTVPGSGVLHNSRCTVDAASSSISGAGNILAVKLSITFSGSYAGNKIVSYYAVDAAANLRSQSTIAGVWTVPGISPKINPGGIASAAGNIAGLSPGSWISIYGQNLAQTSDDWSGFINGSSLPTSIDGVTVSIDGKLAAISFVSPTQINAQVPDDANIGPVPVVVSNAFGSSAAQTANMATYVPAFFTIDGTHIAARHADYSLLGPLSIASATPAMPGETVLLYGTGFGPTVPHTPSGVVVSSVNPLQSPASLQISIGGVNAHVAFAGVVAAGLYQFNIVIPPLLPNGDAPVVATIAGQSAQSGVSITIQN